MPGDEVGASGCLLGSRSGLDLLSRATPACGIAQMAVDQHSLRGLCDPCVRHIALAGPRSRAVVVPTVPTSDRHTRSMILRISTKTTTASASSTIIGVPFWANAQYVSPITRAISDVLMGLFRTYLRRTYSRHPLVIPRRFFKSGPPSAGQATPLVRHGEGLEIFGV